MKIVRHPLEYKDPLVFLGLIILAAGVILLSNGFFPYNQPAYRVVASGSVPFTDPSAHFNLTPEATFQNQYSSLGPFDKIECSLSSSGYSCYGLQFIGMQTVYSISSRYYGLGMMALAALSIFASVRFGPLRPKEKLTRPITVRVDEDICVANGVCVELAPTVFQLKKQESPSIFAPLAYVVDPSSVDNDTILQAAQMCPTGAIIIEDAETGERIHPPLSKD